MVSNSSVGKLLDIQNIVYKILQDGHEMTYLDLKIQAVDSKHEEIFDEIGQVQNTGYIIADKLFYPGDSFAKIDRGVDILALPVAGPWCRIADSIRYALSIKPKIVFPVHDGMLIKERIGAAHSVVGRVLGENGIEFKPIVEDDILDC